jgi:hypothetical protein
MAAVLVPDNVRFVSNRYFPGFVILNGTVAIFVVAWPHKANVHDIDATRMLVRYVLIKSIVFCIRLIRSWINCLHVSCDRDRLDIVQVSRAGTSGNFGCREG